MNREDSRRGSGQAHEPGRRSGEPDRPRRPSGKPSVVLAWARQGRIEVRLRDFSQDDLEAIRSIPGRRWRPDRRIWVLPDSAVVRERLDAAFGQRLVLTEDAAPTRPAAGPHDAAIGERASGSGPGSRLGPGSAARAGSREALLEAVRVALRAREYSSRTEGSYLAWVRRFLDFHEDTAPDPPVPLDAARGRSFLEHLAVDVGLGAKTRNQATSALGFLFREVLCLEGFESVPRAKEPRHLPTVLSHREVLEVLGSLRGKHRLIVSLLYSAGLRLQECLHIRVRDVDFDLRQILVRDGKGKKDRYVPLAERVVPGLRAAFDRRRKLHENDLAEGLGWMPLPGALVRVEPVAGYELGWQYVFPSRAVHTDPRTGRQGRQALHPSAVQRAVRRAVRRVGIEKRVTCHTFRHSFATEALRGGCDIRTLQHVLGHEDVRTTMVYLHVVEQTGRYIRSPLDRPSDPDAPGTIAPPDLGYPNRHPSSENEQAAPDDPAS